MFKKISVFFLLCASIAAFSACSDSASDQIVFVSPTIEGTYDVTYFGTLASLYDESDLTLPPAPLSVITDSVTKSAALGLTALINDQTSASTGEVVITKGENGTLKIISKIQMAGGMVEASAADKFQYTEYSPVVPAENRLSGNGVGVKGYNLDETTGELSTTTVEFVDSPFEFYLTGSELTIKMKLIKKTASLGGFPILVDADTIVKAKKRSDDVTVPTKKRFWNFAVDDATRGTYKIDLFASETDGKVVTNDCGAAISSGFANIYNCAVGINQTTKFEGELAVDKDADFTSNMASIFAKVQMNGGIVENTPAEKYMHISYKLLPGLMSAKGLDTTYYDNITKLPTNSVTTYNDSTFKVTMSKDKDSKDVMTIETVISRELDVDGVKKKVDTKTIIKATKTSDVYTELLDTLFYTFE